MSFGASLPFRVVAGSAMISPSRTSLDPADPNEIAEELVTQQSLGFDCGHRVLLDDLVRRLPHIHDDGNFFAGLVGQHDAAYSPTVNTAHSYVGSSIQTCNIDELRFQLVGGAEEILFASDDEDADN